MAAILRAFGALFPEKALLAVKAIAFGTPATMAVAVPRAVETIVTSTATTLAARDARVAVVPIHAPDTVIRIGPPNVADAASVAIFARIAVTVRGTNGTRQTVRAEMLRRALTRHRRWVEIPSFVAQRAATFGRVSFVADARAIADHCVVASTVVVARATLGARLPIEARRALQAPRFGGKAFWTHAFAVALDTVVACPAIARLAGHARFPVEAVHAVHAVSRVVKAHRTRAAATPRQPILTVPEREVAIGTFLALAPKVVWQARRAPCRRVEAFSTDALAAAELAGVAMPIVQARIALLRASFSVVRARTIATIRIRVPWSTEHTQRAARYIASTVSKLFDRKGKKAAQESLQARARSRREVIASACAFAIAKARRQVLFVPSGTGYENTHTRCEFARSP